MGGLLHLVQQREALADGHHTLLTVLNVTNTELRACVPTSHYTSYSTNVWVICRHSLTLSSPAMSNDYTSKHSTPRLGEMSV